MAAVREMPTPTDVTGLKRFLGMANYLARFLPGHADMCQPLRELLNKDIEWHWTARHESAMREVCEAVTKAPVLQYFQASEQSVVQCDASGTGLGAVLLQGGKPVEFASRALSTAERNYAQIEKELLAVLFGLERFDQYVYGRHVYIESDHRPLQIIAKKPIGSAPKRLQRMFLRMQRYEYTIGYRPGKELLIADTLSRAHPTCNGQPCDFEEVAQTSFERTLEQINAVEDVGISSSLVEQLRAETALDTQMEILIKYIRCGWPDRKSQVSLEVRNYFDIRDELTVSEGIVLKCQRCVVPKKLRPEVLRRIHQAHIGREGCIRRAREYVYWPGMTVQVKDFVSRCETCQLFGRKQQQETFAQSPLPSRPWEEVGCDLFEIQGVHYLVTVDYYSNFSEVDRLESTLSTTVIRKMKNHFARYGIPDVVRSDNGPQFSSDEFKRFTQVWQFQHKTSSPFYPQSNGKAENAVKTMKDLMRKAAHAGTDPYQALLDFRNTPTQGMSVIPAQRLLGRRTKTTLPTHPNLLVPAFPDSSEQLGEEKTKQVRRYNKSAKDLPTLQEGDTVMIQPRRSGALWTKAIVVKRLSRRSYRVRTLDGAVYRRNRRQLRLCPEEEREGCEYDFCCLPEEEEPDTEPETTETETEQQSDSEEEDEEQEQDNESNVSPNIVTTRAGRTVRKPAYLQSYIT